MIEAFRPDFYLPEQDLYLEVTVMKQSLVTRKNRKLRKLRELYPDVKVKLFYKRDIERLAEQIQTRPRLIEVRRRSVRSTSPPSEIRARVAELGARDRARLRGPRADARRPR